MTQGEEGAGEGDGGHDQARHAESGEECLTHLGEEGGEDEPAPVSASPDPSWSGGGSSGSTTFDSTEEVRS